MSNPLNGIDADRWYLVWIAAAMIGLVAAIASKERVYAGLAFGLLLFGMGELINHPRREAVDWHWKITIRTRLASPLGLAVECVGLLIAARCGWLLLF